MDTDSLTVTVYSILHMDNIQVIVILLFILIAALYLKNYFSTSHRETTSTLLENNKIQVCTEIDNISMYKAKCLIDHKHMLKELHAATDKCYDKIYAVKCIDLVAYCPHLMNVQSEPHGLTPFHRVCLRGQICLIEYMLSKGANPLLETKTGENALCMAIYFFLNNPLNDDFTFLDILCKAGCNFNLNNDWYRTILKAAADNKNKKLAEWLIRHASPSKVDIFIRCMSVPSILHKQSNHKCVL